MAAGACRGARTTSPPRAGCTPRASSPARRRPAAGSGTKWCAPAGSTPPARRARCAGATSPTPCSCSRATGRRCASSPTSTARRATSPTSPRRSSSCWPRACRAPSTSPTPGRRPGTASPRNSSVVRAFHHTYGLPTLTTNCSNNYGPFQFPEKLVPLMILNCLAGKPLPVYGDGGQVRDWLYVADHCRAIRSVLRGGRVGEVYNVGGACERTNLEVVREICRIVDRLRPGLPHAPCESLITSVADRPGHDRRYAIDFSKIERELGWRPEETFASGLERTVAWYLANAPRLGAAPSGAHLRALRRRRGGPGARAQLRRHHARARARPGGGARRRRPALHAEPRPPRRRGDPRAAGHGPAGHLPRHQRRGDDLARLRHGTLPSCGPSTTPTACRR